MENEGHTEQQEVADIPEARVRSISFSILTEAEAGKIAAKVIGVVSEVTDPALGIPNLSNQCLTCGGKCLKTCEGHFGIINFPYTIINPYFLPEVAKILNRICPACKSFAADKKVKSAEYAIFRGKRNKCKYCDGKFRNSYPIMRFKVSPRDMFGKTAIVAEVLLRGRSERIASDYWDFIPPDPQIEKNNQSSTRRLLSHAQVYDIVKEVDPSVLQSFLRRKNDIFLNCLLVTPNCHRLTEFGHHITFDASTKLYKKLADFKGTANELSIRTLDRIKVSKVRSDKSSDVDSASVASGLKYVKEILLAKRNDHSFRTVVVGDPNLKLDEIGVPCQIAEKLRVAEHVNKWNLDELERYLELMLIGGADRRVRRGDKLVRLSLEDKLQKGDILYRPLSDGDILLINRPPSIHQHSLLALSVKVLPIGSVLAINPLVCSPLRGDFDGDCLHGYIPQSVDSRVELLELVALNKQLFNGQSGRHLLSLSHDSLTAAHLILGDGVILNEVQMQQLQMFCPRQLQLPAIVCTNLAKARFWTGKQLFSLFLPPGFEYLFPSNGVLIRKGEILTSSNGSSWLRDNDENLFHHLVKYCREETLDLLFAAQEVLCEWLSMRGLSVSLSDLYLASDTCLRNNLIDEVSCGLQEAELQSYISTLMLNCNQQYLSANSDRNERMNFAIEHMSIQQQASAPISQAFVSAFKQVFLDIQHLAYQYANKDNAFLTMLRAGSKGNLLKLVQHSMCLGLQNSVVPLSFRIPHQLSCAAWNDQKISDCKAQDIPEHSKSYIPLAVVKSSFLTGLNPLECFVHSLTNRDGSFSGHADVSGTINRKLMFFMRDLYVAYDGTVRNAYGNQLVQFSYNNTQGGLNSCNDNKVDPHESSHNSDIQGGHPVGSLAACAISEAAYSALDLPCSALETSPLLNLKKILECGVKKSSGDRTASLFLSKKLGRWPHGFEYGALEVKCHLERLLFSDIISRTLISFSSETGRRSHMSPWICHFHICKEIVRKKRLRMQSIIDALHMRWYSVREKLKITLPQLHITSKGCSLAAKGNEMDTELCIAASVSESSRNRVKWDILRDVVIPFLLGTVIKGFPEFEKVDILWKDAKSSKGTPNGLYLRVFMSENCDKTKFWSILVDSCLQIWAMIDWECSRPDDINDITRSYGVDAAVGLFRTSLNSAICDTGKTVLPEHVILTADCLSATGEFVALNPKGLALQRKQFGVVSPLNQACFSSPSDNLVRAAKTGAVDNLQGTVDALAWGRKPPIGTGAQFDIMYSWKDNEPTKPTDVYSILDNHIQEAPKVKLPKKQPQISAKSLAQHLFKFEDLTAQPCKSLTKPKPSLFGRLSVRDILNLSVTLRNLLHKYEIDSLLTEEEKTYVLIALWFHPQKREKIGTGIVNIKVGSHAKYEESRCFVLERKDGTVEDFSYHKCVYNALKGMNPDRAKLYESKWLKSDRQMASKLASPKSF